MTYLFKMSDRKLSSKTARALARCTVETLETRRMLAEIARPADAFVDSIGVNTHFGYSDTAYNPASDFNAAKGWLQNLGVRHVRDGSDIHASSSKLWMQDLFRNLYQQTGIKTTFGTSSNYGAVPNDVLNLINRVTPAALDAIEGANEPDNGAIGGSGNAAAVQWQNGIYASVHNSTNPAINRIPLIGASPIFGYSGIAPNTNMDFQNAHPYPGAKPINESIDQNIANADAAIGAGNPGKTLQATETGYELGTTPGDNNGVNQRAAGIYAPRLILENWNRGIARTDYYQLAQGGEVSHGLLNVTGWANGGFTVTSVQYQPSYYALQNLISTLQEPGATIDARRAAGSSFKPGSLDWTMSAPTQKAEFYGGANIHHTLLQKSDGSFYLVLWNEVRSFDPIGKTDYSIAPVPVTLKFGTSLSSATSYSQNYDGSLTSSGLTLTGSAGAQTVSVSVRDTPTIVKLTPAQAQFLQTGQVNREVWSNVPGTAVSSIPTNLPPDSVSSISKLEAPNNVADNYGQRLRGYVTAPETGPYRFWISSEGNSEFWLSRSAGQEGGQQKIATASNSGNKVWSASSSQKSQLVYLQAGERYYFEVLHKSATGNDSVAVAWAKPSTAVNATAPDEVLPGTQLSPVKTYSFMDQLDDWRRTSSHTAGLAFGPERDGNQNAVDGSVVRKLSDASSESIVWNYTDISNFYAYGYDEYNSSYDAANVRFYSSPDGVNWTQIATRMHRIGEVSGQVYNTAKIQYEFTPAGPIATGTNYLKYEFPAAAPAYQFRIGSMTIASGQAVAPLSQATSNLPAGWTARDTGPVDLYGSASFNANTGIGGTWTISGSGNDIWNNGDQMHFASRTTSDSEVILSARITSQTRADGYTRAGLMLRSPSANNAINSANVGLYLTPDNGVLLQYRSAQGQAYTLAAAVPSASMPQWLRLQRAGNLYLAFSSVDGVTWTQVGPTLSLNLPTSLQAGLVVSAHDPNNVSTATFDHVSLTPRTINGTSGNDQWLARLAPGESGVLQIFNNLTGAGLPLYNLPVGAFRSVGLLGSDGDDTLVVDFANGDPMPYGGLVFRGGANTASGDTLIIRNSAGPTAFNRSSTQIWNTQGAISFPGVENIVFEAAAAPITSPTARPVSRATTSGFLTFSGEPIARGTIHTSQVQSIGSELLTDQGNVGLLSQ